MFLMVVLSAGCGNGSDAEPPFEVSSDVVAHEATQGISVWSPEAEGAWPIVYMLHGLRDSRESLAETATGLATQGVVVLAADYRSTEPQHIERDTECGYRHSLSVAEEYGGDLDQPITVVGHSFGAELVIPAQLDEEAYGPDGTYDECLTGAPRADVIVAISGCHYEAEGQQFEFDTSGYTNPDADLVLVVGEDDTLCPAWQSEAATEALRSAGYEAKLVVIPGGNHFNVIFHDVIDGQWVLLPDGPAGKRVVQEILDAISAARS
jgi:alpha-beta hydrolase superfamily lysophospholipase